MIIRNTMKLIKGNIVGEIELGIKNMFKPRFIVSNRIGIIVVVLCFRLITSSFSSRRQFYGYLSFKRFITVLWITFPNSRRKSKEIDGSCNEFSIISNVETFINHLDDSRNLSLLSRLDFYLHFFPHFPYYTHTFFRLENISPFFNPLFFSFILFRFAKYELFPIFFVSLIRYLIRFGGIR